MNKLYTIREEEFFPRIEDFLCGDESVNTYARRGTSYWIFPSLEYDDYKFFIARDRHDNPIGFAVVIMYGEKMAYELSENYLDLTNYVNGIDNNLLYPYIKNVGLLEVIGVQKSFQKKGIAQALINVCLDLPLSYLFVEPTPNALRFWINQGFLPYIKARDSGLLARIVGNVNNS